MVGGWLNGTSGFLEEGREMFGCGGDVVRHMGKPLE